MRGSLLLERAEIVIGPELESDARAFCVRAMAQNYGMVVNRVCEIDGISFLRNEPQPKDIE